MNPHLQHCRSDSVLVVRVQNMNPHLARKPEPEHVRARLLGWHCTDNPMWCEAEIEFQTVGCDNVAQGCGRHRVYGSALATALVEVLA